jgi:diadenosine tetraphosphate (Ap4A) HIT family hydrolase
MNCPFCELLNTNERILLQNDLAFVIEDGFPVSKGHTLIISKRHVSSLFDLSHEETTAILDLARIVQKAVQNKYQPDGYTVGFNDLEASGQSIPHCHLHIIPRYKGDVKNPRGGIRGVIPGKQEY